MSSDSPQNKLQALVNQTFKDFLKHHQKGQEPNDLYQQFLACVEPPLLLAVIDHTQGNIKRASEILGLHRATLKKKLNK